MKSARANRTRFAPRVDADDYPLRATAGIDTHVAGLRPLRRDDPPSRTRITLQRVEKRSSASRSPETWVPLIPRQGREHRQRRGRQCFLLPSSAAAAHSRLHELALPRSPLLTQGSSVDQIVSTDMACFYDTGKVAPRSRLSQGTGTTSRALVCVFNGPAFTRCVRSRVGPKASASCSQRRGFLACDHDSRLPGGRGRVRRGAGHRRFAPLRGASPSSIATIRCPRARSRRRARRRQRIELLRI
jgi:hypothetical protein